MQARRQQPRTDRTISGASVSPNSKKEIGSLCGLTCKCICRLSISGAMTCFFCQAEDGMRDADVTGVQTCALPIWGSGVHDLPPEHLPGEWMPELVALAEDRELLTPLRAAALAEIQIQRAPVDAHHQPLERIEIGRASCRERG